MLKHLIRLPFFFLTLFSIQALGNPLIAKGKHGMVVSSHQLATKVGVDVLEKGGNAIDAAVAMGYALAVVHPCCGNIGGGGFMMIHLADGHSTVLNFREKAPAALTAKKLENSDSPYAIVGIPGTVKGLNTALKTYGTMPLEKLMLPAINLADKGFVLQPKGTIRWFETIGVEAFKKQPNVERIFLNKGNFYQPGDRLIQKDLANTLRLISNQGEKAFYHGAIADEIAKANKKNGGFITRKDLANYSVTFKKPLACQYRGNDLLLTPPPSTGGLTLCELLKVVEGFPLKKYGYGSLEKYKVNLEAIRYVYHDKAKYMGDSAFISIPVQMLLSSQYIKGIQAKVRKAIRANDKKLKQAKPGLPPRFEKADTTSYIVADAKGNVVAVTYTVNGPFGAQVIPGKTGFFLNSELEDFTYGNVAKTYKEKFGVNPNAPAPGKTPASSITQVIMLNKDKKPTLVLATPGGDTIPSQMLQLIQNFVDYEKTVPDAVNSPRYFLRWAQGKVFLEPELKDKRKLLLDAGYQLGKGSGCSESGTLPHCGGMTAIYIDPKDDSFLGVVDWRRPAGMAGAVEKPE